MTRLAVARLWFCSNSFTPRRTRMDDVRAQEWATGPDALSAGGQSGADAGSELDGVRAFLAGRPGWEVTMLRCASAAAGGPLSADVFGSWMADVEDALRRGRFDAVYLSLHGACQAEGDPAADVTILRRVRAIVGHAPVVASFDMRANLSEETAILLDGASANRAWPDGGGREAALRALNLLEGIIAGRCRPVGALARVPMVLPDVHLHAALSELWRDGLPGGVSVPGLRDANVLDASVFGGFAWGDSPYAGPSALVWADRDAGLARETAARLALSLARWRTRLVAALPNPASALAGLAAASTAQPALLLDVGDDPASGGLADTPELLRAVLAASAEGRMAGRVAVAAFFDPDTVAVARSIGVGGTFECHLGGRMTSLYGAPVPVRVTVVAMADVTEAGPAAILRVGAVDILVTARRPARVSLALLAEAGLRLDGLSALVVKGGEIARIEFGSHFAQTIGCDCPGPVCNDLMRLPFHYVPALRRAPPAVEPHSFDAAGRDAAGGDAGRGDGAYPLRGRRAPIGAPGLADSRNDERRATPQQKRSETFGAQRR